MQRAGLFLFAALLALSLAAFWPTYFFPPRYEADWHVHLHGVVMFAWVVLLVAQAWLLRTRRLAVHRRLGPASYALVPAIVATTLILARYRFATQGVTPDLLYFLAVQLGLLVALAVAYGLAIRHRRAPALHGRYMVVAALPLLDPILARVLAVHAAIEPPLLQWITYGLTDAVLLALLWRDPDRRAARRVYPAMLAVLVATQAPTFLLPATAAWRAFGEAFTRLPLP